MKTNITKQIILGTLITFGLFSAAKAQTAYDDQAYTEDQSTYNQPQQQQQHYQQPAPVAQQNGQQSFYYYPDANVYYNNSDGRYIYNNDGSWLSVNVLPANIYLGGSSRYMVYHRGPQVWLDNPIHIRNYYRAGYRQPIVAYNNYYRHDGFANRGFARAEVRRDAGFNRGFDRGRGGRR